jgi:hypothetical protein
MTSGTPYMKLFRQRAAHFVFVGFCAVVLIILLRAPEETTPPLPRDEIHQEFYLIKSKKEAEKGCTPCHSASGEAPLPADHPPGKRCLFCHKRNG